MRYLTIVFGLLLAFSTACSKPPVKTEDPAEIEKLRQEHKSTAQRELADG